MKLSDAVLEVEEWMNFIAYDFTIADVMMMEKGKYCFDIIEYGPDGSNSSYCLMTNPDGTLTNENDENVVEISIEACGDKNSDAERFLKAFRAKHKRSTSTESLPFIALSA